MASQTWAQAWYDALYSPGPDSPGPDSPGPDSPGPGSPGPGSPGFFLREDPADHFRTNVAVPLFADAVRTLAERVDAALGHPDPFDLVDVGAGRGQLLAALGEVPSRWRLTGVDLATADVPFAWSHEIPSVTGLLLANEWLDAVPLDILEDDHLVLVDARGRESRGAPLGSDWARRWWPSGGRVEVGAPRDLAWAAAVAKVRRGLAVAIDYDHDLTSRRPTLTGYRAGRQVPPVPDGSCDLTAHVALDACAAAGGGRVLRQREALTALGITAALPAPDARDYAGGLERASQARELLDPDGLGGFGWLVSDVGWMKA